MKRNGGEKENSFGNFFKALFKKINKKDKEGVSKVKVYIEPEKEIKGVRAVLGYLCRAAVIFLSVFGLTYLLYEAVGIYQRKPDFRIYTIPLYALAFISAAVAVLCTFIPFNKITRKVIPPSSALLFVLWFYIFSKGNIFLLIENAARRLYNDVLYGVSLSGFTSAAAFMMRDDYSFDKKIVVLSGAVIFCTVLGILFYFAVSKKARMLLYCATESLIIVPVLMLNLPGENTGFAVVVSSAVGFIALYISESIYLGRNKKHDEKLKRRFEKKQDRKERRDKTKLYRLRVKEAAQGIYDSAIEAGMGKKNADKAKRAIYIRAAKEEAFEKKKLLLSKQEEKREKRLQKKAEKETVSACKKQKAEEKNRIKKLSSSERAEAERKFSESKKLAKKALREEKKEKRAEKKLRRNLENILLSKKRAAGGFAGAGAALLAFLAIWLPASISSKPFATIGFIEKYAAAVRAGTDDILMGDDVDLSSSSLYSSFEKLDFQTLSFDAREFDGTQIYLVDSARGDPVYLKGRTAVDFDIENNKWTFPNSADVLDFRENFGAGFSSDDITTEAYALLYPGSSETVERGNYQNFSRYGFYTERIHVFRANGKSRLLLTPSVMNRRAGLLTRGKTSPAKDRYVSYFDGIYTTRYYGSDSSGYSTVSYIYNFKRNDISNVFESEAYVMDLLYELQERERNGTEREELAREYNVKASRIPVYNDLGERYFLSMNDSEREEVINFLELERKYRKYVHSMYTKAPASNAVAELADSIKSNAESEKGGELTEYETVLAVINYLDSEEFVYTLTPRSSENTNILEAFLFETKEGYCSHFATSAVSLLRCMGVPVRFAEGYKAGNFEVMAGTMPVEKYSCLVLDSDAHAWIEVYFDGIGWIPFETTKSFVSDMYKPYEDSQGSPVLPEDPGSKDDEPTDGEDDGNDTPFVPIPSGPVGGLEFDGTAALREKVLKQFKILLICVAAVIAVWFTASTVIKLVKKRAKKFLDKRSELLANARSEEFFRDKNTDKRALAKYIDDCIFEIFSATGVGPEKGELLKDFGARLKKEYPGLSTKDPEFIAECILKEEFGDGLNFKELSSLAEYLSDITVSLYTGLTASQKIRLRYIKHII